MSKRVHWTLSGRFDRFLVGLRPKIFNAELQRWNSCSNWLVHHLCRCRMSQERPLGNILVLVGTKKKEEMNWTNNLLVSILSITK